MKNNLSPSLSAAVADAEANIPHTPLLGSFRLMMATMFMCCLFCLTSLRMNLGMAIVCMVNSTAFVHKAIVTPYSANMSVADTNFNIRAVEHDDRYDQCNSIERETGGRFPDYLGTLLWSPSMQSQLFSAVSYGSLVTVWASGYLSDQFGPKGLMTLTLLDSVIVGFLSPWLAKNSYTSFFAARVVMGLGEGFVYPSLSTAAARWFPPSERSRMLAYYTIGNQMASVIGFLFSSRMCSLSFWGGWPLIFYLFSVFGLILLVCWLIFMSDGPQGNRWTSDRERHYILTSTSSQFLPGDASKVEISAELARSKPSKITNQSIPWRQLARSRALLAIIVAQSGFNITAIILQSFLPTYLKEVLRVDINTNGIISIIPFGVQIVSKILYGVLSDSLKRHGILSATQAAKLFQSIGSYGCAAIFIGLALFGDCTNLPIVVVLLFLYGAVFSAGICGFFTSMLSIAPAYSGLVTSVTMTFGFISNAFGPLLVALIHNTGDESEWAIIFYIVAIYNTICGTVFLLFSSAEIQEWARPKSRILLGVRVRPLDAGAPAAPNNVTKTRTVDQSPKSKSKIVQRNDSIETYDRKAIDDFEDNSKRR